MSEQSSDSNINYNNTNYGTYHRDEKYIHQYNQDNNQTYPKLTEAQWDNRRSCNPDCNRDHEHHYENVNYVIGCDAGCGRPRSCERKRSCDRVRSCDRERRRSRSRSCGRNRSCDRGRSRERCEQRCEPKCDTGCAKSRSRSRSRSRGPRCKPKCEPCAEPFREFRQCCPEPKCGPCDDDCQFINKCDTRGIHIIKGTGVLIEAFADTSLPVCTAPIPFDLAAYGLGNALCPYFEGCLTISNPCDFETYRHINFINGDLYITTPTVPIPQPACQFPPPPFCIPLEYCNILPVLLGINGNLIINGTPYVKLTGFANLRYVTGHIVISNNPALIVAPSFMNLIEVAPNYKKFAPVPPATLPTIQYQGAYILIYNNLSLRRLVGYEKLKSLRDGLFVINNPCLSHICGFINLCMTDYIVISENANLHHILGFCLVTAINKRLVLYKNNHLNKGSDDFVLNAFHKLHTVKFIDVFLNENFKDFTLESLLSVSDRIAIRGNFDMECINMPRLQTVGSLFIEQNKSLKRVNFECLHTIQCKFEFNSNSCFEILDGFNALKTVGHSIQILNNNRLCQITGFKSLCCLGSDNSVEINFDCGNTIQLVFGVCGAVSIVCGELNLSLDTLLSEDCCKGGLFAYNYDVDAKYGEIFDAVLGCKRFEANPCCNALVKEFNCLCETDCAQPSFSKPLIYSLLIFNNSRLKVLGGFENLLTVGSNIIIADNRRLHTICAFASVEFAIDLRIIGNKNLKFIYGFSKLKHIRYLLLLDSPCLEQWQSLKSLPYAQYLIIESKYAKSVKGIMCPFPTVIGIDTYFSFDHHRHREVR